jgi:pantothenate kinase
LSLHPVARSNGLAGGSYEKFGLSASIVASAFGKMIMKDAPRAADVTDADIARSLLNMVGHNIAQLAYVALLFEEVLFQNTCVSLWLLLNLAFLVQRMCVFA